MPVTRLPLTGARLSEPLDFARAGMPAADSVLEASAFIPVAGGQTVQILRSTEFDAYESSPETAAVSHLLQQGQPSAAALVEALRIPPARLSDNFAGTARAAAKLSIAIGPTEQFVNLRALIGTLPPDEAMVHHVPPIATSSSSTRVTEEQRNVRLVGFLYAASREQDNDFHLIVGRDPAVTPEMYMTMEVSGLPPAHNPSFSRLKSARDAFKAFFGVHLPALTYDFYHPPIPVTIEGSVFFDLDHAVGQHPGPPSLKSRMPTVWEVHPVTAIALGSIQEIEPFVSPRGDAHLILKTSEVDAYDEAPKPKPRRRSGKTG